MNEGTQKLSVSLVPGNAWGRNVRALVSSMEWQRLRWKFGATLDRPVGNNGGYMCGTSSLGHKFLVCKICESRFDILHLHELWRFDDTRTIQKLVGFKSICEGCHNAIHFGRASVVGLADQAYSQLIKINGWTEKQAKEHVRNALVKWRERENFHYRLDISLLSENKWVLPTQIHLDWLDRPRRVRDRIDALSWSQTLLTLPHAVILDTETTGLIEGPKKNPNTEVIELAIISVSGEVLYNGRFKPLYTIPDHVIEIHGIKNEALKKAPSFAKKYPEIVKILHGKIVVAYNSRFDQKVIENTCRMNAINSPENIAWECAMWTYKGYQESPQFLRLPNGKHSALADCMATLDLIKKMSRDEHVI